MLSQAPLQITDADAHADLIEQAIQPIQITSMTDIASLVKKLVSLGIASLDENMHGLSKGTDPDDLAEELLLSNDGKTYLKTELCQLPIEVRSQLPVYFLRMDAAHGFSIIKASDIAADENDFLVNRLLAQALCQLDFDSGNLRSGFKFPNLNGSFDNLVAFVNPAFEGFIWVLCQNAIRQNNTADKLRYSKAYEGALDEFKEFFSHKQKQLKEFYDFMEKMSQESLILAEIKDQNLSPAELHKIIYARAKDEAEQQKTLNLQKMRGDKLYVEQKKLDLGIYGLYAASIFGFVGAPGLVAGLSVYYALILYRSNKMEHYNKDQEKIPETLQNFVSQMPSINYLTTAIANAQAQLALKIQVIDNELSIVKLGPCGSVKIEEVVSSSLQTVIGYPSSLIFKRLGTADKPIITEPDDEEEKTASFSSQESDTASNSNIGTVIIEEVREESGVFENNLRP